MSVVVQIMPPTSISLDDHVRCLHALTCILTAGAVPKMETLDTSIDAAEEHIVLQTEQHHICRSIRIMGGAS